MKHDSKFVSYSFNFHFEERHSLGFFQLNSAYFKGVKVLYKSKQKEKIYFTFGKYLRPDLPRVKCLFVLLFVFPFSILKS